MNKKSTFYQKLCASPHILWSAIFIIVPLLMVAYYSFTDANGSFTMENIYRLTDYTDTFLRSLWYGIIATLICLVMAYPIAYFISQSKARAQTTMIMLVMIPMWMNFLIRTYAWMNILEDSGVINKMLSFLHLPNLHMINTPSAVILGMVYNFLPYMILPIYSVLTKLDRSLVEAAQDLGANKFNVFLKVIFPMSVSGIVSGITMVFVPSVSTFYISQKLGGGTFALIGDIIEMQFQVSNNFNFGAALSLVLMVLILICMAFMNKFSDTEDAGGGMVV
ncbi:MAG: ABC transporter permease [Clostridia bacterium]|nr:ABC transporter permease [Clostridia bacterium]